MRILLTACAVLTLAATSFADMTNATGDRPNIFTGHVLTATPGTAGGAILYAPSEADDPAYRDAIAVLSGATVDYFDTRAATPDVALLMNYDMVYTWTNFAHLDNVAFGDNLASYVDAGGKVVLGAFCTYTSGNSLSGMIMTDAYCPVVSPAGNNHFAMSPYIGDGVTCIHDALVSVVNYDCTFRDFLVLQGTGIQDGTYMDGEIAHAYRDDFNVFYSNGCGAIQLGCPGEWAALIANIAKCTGVPATCAAVSGFTATDPDCDTDTIELSWTVNMGVEAPVTLEIVRDGSPLVSLPATDTSYTDTGVADGSHTYEITVSCTASTSSTRTATVDSTSTGAAQNVIWAAEAASQIDSVAAVQAALTNAGQTYVVVGSLTDPYCGDASTTIWAITGTFPDNFQLDAANAQALADHANAGGNIHFEGGDTWGFDPQTVWQTVDGVEDGTALDGGDDYLSMDGLNSGVGADASGQIGVPYNQDQAGNDYTDQIQAATADSLGPDAGVLWQQAGGAYNTGVAYSGSTGARIISQSWEFGGFGGSHDDLMAIELAFFGAPPAACFTPTALAVSGDCDSGDQTLTWNTPSMGSQPLEDIEISRDGTVIATVPGTDTMYVDSSAPDGPATYSIRALCGGGTSSGSISVSTTVISGGAPSDIVVRADFGGGLVDSATAVEAALTAAGRSWTEYANVADIPCIDSGTTLWMITGTFPDNFALDAATGTFLLNHVTSGGALYFEGGDTWGFDAQTDFQLVDGIEDGTAFDGGDDYLSMDGVAGNIDTSDLVGVAYTQDQAGNDYTDQVFAATADSAGPNSTVIWTITGGAYNTGVAYETDDPNGNVVSQSWEFGGFGGDQDDLMSRYLGFLKGGAPPMPGYLRGDCNSDGGVDISDAIFGLSALFVPGSPTPACLDSADINSDGGFDISDMIFVLSSLFVPGSPSPAAPFPACGPGPIVLGCGTPQC